jgi:MFS family permease
MDPSASRRAKRQRRAGDRRFLAAAIAVAAVMVACAFLLGLAIATTADMLRHFSIDSSFDDREPFPMFWGVGTIGYLWILGTFGLVVGSTMAAHLIDVYRGGEQQPRILASLAACAVAVAVVVDAPTWLAPLAVGVNLDPVFHEDTPWNAFEWIAYYADLWLPTLVVVIAGLVVAYSVRHYRRLRRQLSDRDRLLAEGRRTGGVVTGVTVRTTVNDQGQRSVVGADVTVMFIDVHGVERWVTRFSSDRSAMPGTGFAEVLFDPLRPGDQDLIFVSFHPEPAPAEWIGPEI